MMSQNLLASINAQILVDEHFEHENDIENISGTRDVWMEEQLKCGETMSSILSDNFKPVYKR